MNLQYVSVFSRGLIVTDETTKLWLIRIRWLTGILLIHSRIWNAFGWMNFKQIEHIGKQNY